MIIERNEDRVEVEILEEGDVFELNRCIYMAFGTKHSAYNCINLTNGTVDFLLREQIVILLNERAKLVVG